MSGFVIAKDKNLYYSYVAGKLHNLPFFSFWFPVLVPTFIGITECSHLKLITRLFYNLNIQIMIRQDSYSTLHQ